MVIIQREYAGDKPERVLMNPTAKEGIYLHIQGTASVKELKVLIAHDAAPEAAGVVKRAKVEALDEIRWLVNGLVASNEKRRNVAIAMELRDVVYAIEARIRQALGDKESLSDE